ncbi:MAG: hypothetical protein ACMUHX_01390 [bacterium]
MRLKVLAIFLVCLILALSILDAPEYVHCVHIDICEFLDLHGHLDNILKSDIIKRISFAAKNNFYLVLEDLTDSKELLKRLIIFYLIAILYIFKISCAYKKTKDHVLLNTKHKPPLFEKNLVPQTLKFVEISVILS